MWNVGGRGELKAKLTNNSAHNLFSWKTSLLTVQPLATDFCSVVVVFLFFYSFFFSYFISNFPCLLSTKGKKSNVRLVISWGGVERHGKEAMRNLLLFISGSKAYA